MFDAAKTCFASSRTIFGGSLLAQNAGLNNFPGIAGIGVFVIGIQPPVQFCPLCLRQFYGLRNRSDTVPNLFNQKNLFSNTELQRIGHQNIL